VGAGSGWKSVKGSHVERHVCGGAPLDSDGELRAGINDCPFEPSWVCLGLMPGAHGEPVQVIILGCDLHSPAIVRVLAQWGDPESAGRVEIDALDVIVRELGPDLHVLEPAAA
jgi:hypothetical protein